MVDGTLKSNCYYCYFCLVPVVGVVVDGMNYLRKQVGEDAPSNKI